jgi:drug/metabolite transporter (DMT)-like permease
LRRNKPWFGPIPSIGKAIIPVSWEGYAVTVAFVVGLGLLPLESDPTRRSIALALLAAAYCVVVILTWGDTDAEVRPGRRETLFNKQTLVWLAFLLVLTAALAAAAYDQRSHPRPPAPWLHPLAPHWR